MKNIAVILAGGSGRRIGGNIPKQFLSINGKTVLEYSITAFQKNQMIDEIVIVTNSSFLEETRAIIKTPRYSKVSKILIGGAERHHSTLSALKAFEMTECNLIIHDAVRPLVTEAMITNVIQALTTCEACTTAVQTTDTILESDPEKQYISSIPNRNFLYNVQTPQAFRRHTLQKAYHLALQDPDFHSTDDCGVVKKYLPETPIKIIAGCSSNIKLTYPEDIPFIEHLLNTR